MKRLGMEVSQRLYDQEPLYCKIRSHLCNEGQELSSAKQLKNSDFSDLAKIDPVLEHPVDMFRSWREEAQNHKAKGLDICCLATVSKDCKVSARNVVLREFDNDGFVIATDDRSRKINDIKNIPTAAMCYVWFYTDENKQSFARQVRVEGTMKRLGMEVSQRLYDQEPLYCKIRSHLCNEGQIVWDEQKKRHDEMLNSFQRNKIDLSMPDYFVAYKMLPTMMEFYFSKTGEIADRIIYRRKTSNGSWKYDRLAA